jgi:hypothetical protein
VYGPGTNIAGEKGDQLVSKQDALTIVDSIVNSPGNKSLLDKELNKFFTDNTNGKFTSTRPVKTNEAGEGEDEEAIYLEFDEETENPKVGADPVTANERKEGVYYYNIKAENQEDKLPTTTDGKVYIF